MGLNGYPVQARRHSYTFPLMKHASPRRAVPGPRAPESLQESERSGPQDVLTGPSTASRLVLLLVVALAGAGCVRGASPTEPTATGSPSLNIAPVASMLAPYDRSAWPHWTDADGDCQDTRAEVLVATSLSAPGFADARRCVVVSGQWLDPYTQQVFTRAEDLDIDHLVPLANAYRAGGWDWPRTRREAYANDLVSYLHLVPVSSSANRAKGDRGPEAWRPPATIAWCTYATTWIAVKQRWSLTATADEWRALEAMRASCR